MAIARLAVLSMWNRRVTAGLTVLGVCLSVVMLLGVEKVRRDARTGFASTISGTDLIVGARSGAVQLLLYSVFRIGNATNNISYESYREIAAHPKVKWTVPISLGDSHRGFRVMGTSLAYFDHYRYADRRPLVFASGEPFAVALEAVLGARVAEELGYALGERIVVAHGAGDVSLIEHDDKPFVVAGILEPTGTPVDRTVHVSLEGIEAIHVDWKDGVKAPGASLVGEDLLAPNLEPKAITAFMVGLESKIDVFRVLRHVNEYRAEPMLAIIPGVALQELWDLMGVAENALRAVSGMVVLTGMLGMLTVILSSLESRRREMAVLRSVGARPLHVFGLFMSEAALLALVGIGCGVALLYACVLALRPVAAGAFGLHLPVEALAASDYLILGLVLLAGCLAGSVPALRAYRLSLADGLSVRI